MVVGLRRLGFDVVFVEQAAEITTGAREHFERVCTEFNIDGYLLAGAPQYELVARAEAATLLLDVGGHLTRPELKRGAKVRVFLDDDPGYTQLWQHDGLLPGRLDGYDFHFTFGENIGRPDCPLPVNGIDWRPMRPPVVLDQWPVESGHSHGFRTVASWRGAYGRVESDGHLFGQKAHEFRRFAEIPEHVEDKFEIALDIEAADISDAEMLKAHGWSLVDPASVTGTTDLFHDYVQESGAEFSAAQGVYVETCCGWFSDRTTRYLASGKPALVQDTGFTRNLPSGEGLIAFSTLAQAIAGAESIRRDHASHARCAREIAERYFDSDIVLGRMLDEVGL